MLNMKYVLNFLLLMTSTRLAVSSHQADPHHRTPKQNSNYRAPLHTDHKNGPYRNDFRTESRQEVHLSRNSNLNNESAQQPENGPPSNFWYNQYVGEPRFNNGYHHSRQYSNSNTEDGVNTNYKRNNPVRHPESEYRHKSRDEYRNNEAPAMQYRYNKEDQNTHYSHNRESNSSRGNEPLSNDGRGFKYTYTVSDDSSQYPRYEGPEDSNRKPPSYGHSSEYISDKNHEAQAYLKPNTEYYQPHPYTSFSNSTSSSSSEHLDNNQRAQNEQIPHKDNPQTPNAKDSHYYSEYRPETSSNSGYKQSRYPKEPYSSDYRDMPQQYHSNSQNANSRLPQQPYPQYTDQPETPTNNFNKHKPKSKTSSHSEQSRASDGRAPQYYQQNTHGQQYKAQGYHEQFRGKTHSQRSSSEESSISDDKNSEHKENDKVTMRVVSTKKDMQQAPSETDSSLAEEHDGFLDMGAYTDKQGSFGWYADFPVGKEHDKVTYSFS